MEDRPYDYLPIEDYGIIGDLHTVALVGMNGSIDWCCLPHFDSPSLFGALLDKRLGGRWQIASIHPGARKQMYFPDTNVLITRFLGSEGVGEVMDCMPVEENVPHSEKARYHRIIRQVTAVRGAVTFRLYCEPAFNYGRDAHEIRLAEQGAVFSTPAMSVGLISPVPLARSAKAVTAEFTLKAGESLSFLLRQAERADDATVLARPTGPEQWVQPTILFWKRWLSRSRYRGRWRETVDRSALTLKLLTYAPTGAIVAAPTCSLPEAVGGRLNWDYRYTWIRDASFTVYAFLRIGFTEEARHFMQWMEARLREAGPHGRLQVLYGIGGESPPAETVLSHWEGYRRSGPVRIGNAAHGQLQLDIYGEMMDSVYLYNKYVTPISHDMWRSLIHILDWMAEHWREPDEGIWETRDGRRPNTHSRVMCWVALDRALRLAGKRSLPIDHPGWNKERDAIYNAIMELGWNPGMKSFVGAFGSSTLDASCLLMPLVKFISPTDPRMLSTLDAIQRELVSDSLVYRYRGGGSGGPEGTFSMCTFWLVECLARAGKVEEARLTFEKMLGYANHLGLYAEEIGQGGEALGNFPQAFTHLGLISAAFNLDRALDGGA
ncbi:MAG TPA: glycoside hydrolase family 15 protein [Fibrobacteria bacterium]|nr:glycoside hydrolase family 15 protein [Fibrobacteria bacterium]